MPAFFEYLRNITYYLMFATVVGMVAPAGKYRKFVSLVLGFVLLLLMVQPLSAFVDDIPVSQWFGNLQIPEDSQFANSSYIDLWGEYLNAAFENQLEMQVASLLSKSGFSVHSVDFSYTNDFEITSVSLSVSRKEVNPSSERVPFIQIKAPQFQPIRIGEQSQSDDCPHALAVKTLISEFYNLPKSHIHVNVNRTNERGD
ncbi:MAG: stage III sporulation protein AF [Defluviitaleaceae bacterium]|nr:stage III sporulation protein AF [Defluviitaleaceae bacterium]